MLVISFFADWMGRKKGSRLCTSIMFIGAILLTAADGSASTYLTLLCIGLSIFGFGVGGEYPLAASSAAERAEGSVEMRKKRGQTIALTFTQQGWGNWWVYGHRALRATRLFSLALALTRLPGPTRSSF